MISCKNCNYENGDNAAPCIVCRYPIGGTEKEKARFISKQVMEKNDVEHAILKVRYTRIALFALGGLMLVLTVLQLLNYGIWTLLSPLFILTVLFFISALISGKYPLTGMSIAMALTVGIYGLQLIFNPTGFASGILWKGVIITIVLYGFSAVLGANKTLRKNPYIADLLGYKSLGAAKKNVISSEILDHSD